MIEIVVEEKHPRCGFGFAFGSNVENYLKFLSEGLENYKKYSK